MSAPKRFLKITITYRKLFLPSISVQRSPSDQYSKKWRTTVSQARDSISRTQSHFNSFKPLGTFLFGLYESLKRHEKTLERNSVYFFLSILWWLDALKSIKKMYPRKSSLTKAKKTDYNLTRTLKLIMPYPPTPSSKKELLTYKGLSERRIYF